MQSRVFFEEPKIVWVWCSQCELNLDHGLPLGIADVDRVGQELSIDEDPPPGHGNALTGAYQGS